MSRGRTTDYGDKLLEARKAAKLSRKALGDRFGLKGTVIEALERNREPRPEERELLAEFVLGAGPHADVHGAPASGPQPAQEGVYGVPTAEPLYEDGEDPSELPYRSLFEFALDDAPADSPGPFGTPAQLPADWAPMPPTGQVGPSKDPAEQRFLYSNSEIQAYKRCKRKWWLAWYRRLRLKIESPTGARAIGNRVHRALQAWYVPDELLAYRTDPRDALERAITQDWTELVTALGGVENVPPDVAKAFQSDTGLERAIIEGYVEWLEETGADQGLRIIAPETYLETTVLTPLMREVKLIGKIDVRTQRESDGALLFIDHKTVGDLTSPVKTLHMDEQMMHYHLLEFLAAVNGEHVQGAIYNMLRKVKRTAKANPPFYGRVEVHHSPVELDSFKMEVLATIDSIWDTHDLLDLGVDHRLAAYPTRTKNCSWDCDFFKVCPLFDDGSRAEDMLKELYVTDDPFEYYRAEEE